MLDKSDFLHIWHHRCYGHIEYEQQYQDRFLKYCTNISFSVIPQPSTANIKVMDVRNGIPFSDNTFGVCYLRRVIEHLTPTEGEKLLLELKRVLKAGGILRITAPDLEAMCRFYIHQLNQLDNGTGDSLAYNISVAEIVDQCTREKIGSKLAEFLLDADREILQDIYNDTFLFMKETGKLFDLQERPSKVMDLVYKVKRKIFQIVNGADPQKSREVNKWLYDRISLKRVLLKTGFKNIKMMDFSESEIPGWEKLQFDSSARGNGALEPRSLYMECIKQAG